MDVQDWLVQHYREMADDKYFDENSCERSIYDVDYCDLDACEKCRYDFEQGTGRCANNYCIFNMCANFTCNRVAPDCDTCPIYNNGQCMGVKNCGGLKKWKD